MEVVLGGKGEGEGCLLMKMQHVCNLGTPRGPASPPMCWVPVKSQRPSVERGRRHSGLGEEGGGRGLFVTNWLFFSLKRILLEKSGLRAGPSEVI